MNEPSNFCDGACASSNNYTSKLLNTTKKSDAEFDPTDPPYQIDNQKSKQVLKTKTLDMDAVHYGGVPEYNAHSLYGRLQHVRVMILTTSITITSMVGYSMFV